MARIASHTRGSDDEPDNEAGAGEAEPDARRRAKQDRTARLVLVLSLLRASGERGLTADQVSQRNGTSKRTAYRDILAIRDTLGLPIFNHDGRWTVSSEAFLPPLRLTLPEAMAVFVAARLATRYADTYDPTQNAALLKLVDTLPKSVRKHLVPVLNEFSHHPTDEVLNRHVDDLATAWAEQRKVSFTYAAAAYDGEHEPTRRVVRPYLLEPSMATHSLYLIGHDEGKNAIRTFKVERILDLSVMPQTFEAPDAGVLAASLRRAWDIISNQPATQVVLRFVPAVAARVRETVWHASQKITPVGDGSLDWQAEVSGTAEIRLWILGWGDEVEVIAPEELRRDVAATHARAASRYTA